MSIEVTHQPDHHRYEIAVDGVTAGIAAYHLNGDVKVFDHTVVQPEFGGQGLAGKLVDGALTDVENSGGRFAATCPYVVQWLDSHHQHDGALVTVP